MRPLTEKQRQWIWFILLWCGGLIGTLLLSYAMRWVIQL